MCDRRTFRRIEQVVEKRMATWHMFTAYDVTLALREAGINRSHREIRRDIRKAADALMWRFGYERTLVRLAESGARAFVYHPYGTDAGLYTAASRARAQSPTRS